MVGAILRGQFLQFHFSAQQVGIQPLDLRIGENVRQFVRGCALFAKIARLPLPGVQIKGLVLSPHQLAGEFPQPGVLDVEALVGGDDSLLPVIIRELGLSVLQIGPQALQLFVEPHRCLLHRFHAQLEHRVDVGFGERVGDQRRKARIGG